VSAPTTTNTRTNTTTDTTVGATNTSTDTADDRAATAAVGEPGHAVLSPELAGGLESGSVTEWAGHRLRMLVTGVFGELRFASRRPVSLVEHLAYARRGEWTEELDGPRRHAALFYAWLIAMPLSTLGYLLAWAAARPSRFVPVVAATLLIATALNQVPVLAWLIPDWLTISNWFTP
jgi:hypothetical protein